MYSTESCPSCSTTARHVRPALISRFIREYALKERDKARGISSFLQCPECDLSFFGLRYDEHEMQNLYGGYRGPEYFAFRNKAEPWYTQRVNSSIGKDSVEISSRQAMLDQIISRHLATYERESISTVLDYGGDMGQFIPENLGHKKFVYEVSNAPTIEGVQRICDIDQLRLQAFDFVILSNVLEHLSEPKSFLVNLMKQITFTKKAYFYVEIPLEEFSVKLVGKNAGYRRYLSFLGKYSSLGKIFDFYSTAFKLKFGLIPPFGYIKQSEHINFFTEKSLKKLIETSCKPKNTFTGVYQLKSSSGQTKVLYCLMKF